MKRRGVRRHLSPALAFAKLLVASASFLRVAFAASPVGVWLDVPYVRQSKAGCGAASIAMVMQYWIAHGARIAGGSSDVRAIEQALTRNSAKGIPAGDLERYFQQAGLRTFAFGGSWADLARHLSQGRPLITGLRARGRRHELHYVVVTGIDQNILMVNDPARRKLVKLRRTDFENDWKATENWTLLVVPRPDAPGPQPAKTGPEQVN